MGTFDNIYLNKIKKLQEENLKLKQIINEVVDSVDLKPDDFEPMDELEFPPTTDELIRKHGKPGKVNLKRLSPSEQFDLGVAHFEAGLPISEADELEHEHYGAGVRHARAFYFPSTLNDTN